MRILHVVQKSQLRGAEIFASQLSNNLQHLGHEVKIVCLFEGQQRLPFNGQIINLRRPPAKRLIDVKGWKQLADLIREFSPDIVQANAGDTLKFAVLSKILFRWSAPIIFRNASMIGLYIKSAWIKGLNTWLFRNTEYVISVTQASKENFLQIFPFMSKRISVVGIGVEGGVIRNTHKVSKTYMLHVGGFTFEKNHGRLLHMFKDIKQYFPSISLLLVGDGLLRGTTQQAAEQMLLKDVQFLGYRDNVQDIMQGAAVLVLPSVVEGLPAVILEAMYCRIPVVAYDIGGISEVVRNGETGWLVKAHDEAAFVDAVRDVLSGRDTSDIRMRAHKMVVEQFDNRVIAQKFCDIYRKVLAQACCL